MEDGCSPPPVPPEATGSTESPWEMVVSAKQSSNSFKEMKFVQPDPAFALMPHYEDAAESVDAYLAHIEMGIVTSALVGDLSPGLHSYVVALKEYIDDFGLRFTDEKMVEMTMLVVGIFTAEGQKECIIYECALILQEIIREPHVAIRDFQCDWRAVLRLFERVDGDESNDGWVVMETIRDLRQFFPVSQTEDILEILRSSGKDLHRMCSLFLPLNATTKEHQKHGAVHWWSLLWEDFQKDEDNTHLTTLFADFAFYAPDFVDWKFHHQRISDGILRTLGLNGGEPRQENVESYAQLVANLFGGPHSFQPLLESSVRRYLISRSQESSRDHFGAMLQFLGTVTETLERRLSQERSGKTNREVSKEFHLTEEDVDAFVSCVIEPTFKAMTNVAIEEPYALPCIVSELTAIRPSAVQPRLFQTVSKVLNTKDYDQDGFECVMSCLEECLPEIALETSPTARVQMINLLEALVSAVDFKDELKAIPILESVACIFNVIEEAYASDCSMQNKELSEEEMLRTTKTVQKITEELWEKLMDLVENGNRKEWNYDTVERITDCIRGTVIKANMKEPLEKLLAILAKSDFDSEVSTAVASMMVKNIVRFHPETFSRISAVVLPRLCDLLEAQAGSGNGKTTANNYASVVSKFTNTSAEVLVKYKEDVCKMIAVLLDSDLEGVVEAGAEALSVVLFKLTRTYILEKTVTEEAKPGQNRKVYWHVDDEAHQREAVELLEKFVFPALEKLKDDSLQGFSLWRQLKIVGTWNGACFLFPLPKAADNSDVTRFSVVPPVAAVSCGISHFHDSGETVFSRFRENLLDISEVVTQRLLTETSKTSENRCECFMEMEDLLCNLLDQSGDSWKENKRITDMGTSFKVLGKQSVDSISTKYSGGIAFQKVSVCSMFMNRIAKLIGEIYLKGNVGDVGSQFLVKLFHSEGDAFLCLEAVLKELGEADFLDEVYSHGSLYNEDHFLSWKKLNSLQDDVPGIKTAKDRCLSYAKYSNYVSYGPGELEAFCYEIWRRTEKTGNWINYSTDDQLLEAKRVAATFGIGEKEFYDAAKGREDFE